MERKIIVTADGSTTIQLPEWNEQYHSKHGAIQEAYHVFIKNGLDLCSSPSVQILEMGFGTGLNAFITFLEAQSKGLNIKYTSVEAYPVKAEEVKALNYVEALCAQENRQVFETMHHGGWEEGLRLDSNFTLTKMQRKFHEVDFNAQFDLIYFDAFGPRVQPELWSEYIFEKMFKALKIGGRLSTYSAKGDVRRAMQAVGFSVNRVEGPPGKREMLVAQRT